VTDNRRALDAATLARTIRNIRLIAFDFDGVFTDNKVYVFQDGREAVRCTRSDGMGLNKLTALGIRSVIISTEPNPVVTARSRKLGIDCIQNCGDKRAAIEEVAQEAGLGLDQIAFVGNDINDLPVLRAVGLPIVVGDAHPDVLAYASYQTKMTGGNGAVREVCDLFEQILRSEGE